MFKVSFLFFTLAFLMIIMTAFGITYISIENDKMIMTVFLLLATVTFIFSQMQVSFPHKNNF